MHWVRTDEYPEDWLLEMQSEPETFDKTPRGFRWLVTALVVVGAVLADRPAHAQTRLYIVFPGTNPFCRTACSPSMLLDVSIDERRILRETTVMNAAEWIGGPAVTADGRWVVWLGAERPGTGGSGSRLSAFELATGVQTSLLDSPSPWIAGSIYADPGSLKLYGQLSGFPNGPIAVVEPHGIRALPDPCGGVSPLSGVGLVGMSGNGARLLGVCSGPPFSNQWRVLTIDPTTGGALSDTLTPVGAIAVDHEGQSFYVASYSTSRSESEFRFYDVASGGMRASRLIANRSSGELVYDSLGRRLFVALFESLHRKTTITALDAHSLATVGEIAAPFADANAKIVADPDNPLLYVLWHSYSATARRTRLSVYETIGFTPIAEAELDRYSDQAQLVLAPRPPRISGLTADLSGSTVTLRWTADVTRSMATGHIVEAGSGPGLADIAILTVAAGQTELVVPQVPRGIYFVRTRGLNGTGRGEPSNEIVVTVP